MASKPLTTTPTDVRLRFKSDYAREFFMGQLSDGWGENHCSVTPVDGQHYVGEVYDVAVFSDWGGESHEIEDEATDRQKGLRVPVAVRDTMTELARARSKFPGTQNSAHEGWAVLYEEVDALWDEVKANHPDRKERMRSEAIQVAAMAIRFIEDLCDAVE